MTDSSTQLQASLTPEVDAQLEKLILVAEEHGWPIYLVGGYVRDSLLGVIGYDIDICVEGDALSLATEVARETGGQVEGHDKFGTATIKYGDSFDLDIVTARKESYPTPGALPVVETGTIYDDLARRDVTINAMAARFTPSGPGTLLDPHKGLPDLNAKLVRVLHEGSFRDDPTRIFRAVKLSRRLGFTVEKGTLELILLAVRDGALYTVSMGRITRELLLIMGEPQGDTMLADLHHLGVLQAIHPLLAWPHAPGQVRPLEQTLTPEKRRDIYLVAIGFELAGHQDDAEDLARALKLPVPFVRLIRAGAELGAAWKELREEKLSRWQIYNLLRDIDIEAVKALVGLDVLSRDSLPWERLNLYLDTLRHQKPLLTGDHLLKAGLAPGPQYREVLEKLLEQKIEGNVSSREDEEAFIQKWLEEPS